MSRPSAFRFDVVIVGGGLIGCASARRFRLAGDVCVGVETDAAVFEAPRVVDAAGAWASFDAGLPFAIPVEPVRGQMVELVADRELPTVIHDDDVYLVPRRGGRTLVGATVERAGFRKEVTARGIASRLTAGNGILLAPVTALRIADLLTGVGVQGLEPFSIDRFAPSRGGFSTASPSTGVFS